MVETLTNADALDVSGTRTDLSRLGEPPSWRSQKPYPNGVVVWTQSGWNGNAFGSSTCKVAVRGTEIVAVYENEPYHVAARILGQVGNIGSDAEWTGYGQYRRLVVTRTVLSKWIEGVKAL